MEPRAPHNNGSSPQTMSKKGRVAGEDAPGGSEAPKSL